MATAEFVTSQGVGVSVKGPLLKGVGPWSSLRRCYCEEYQRLAAKGHISETEIMAGRSWPKAAAGG